MSTKSQKNSFSHKKSTKHNTLYDLCSVMYQLLHFIYLLYNEELTNKNLL